MLNWLFSITTCFDILYIDKYSMGGTHFICIRVSSDWVIRTSYTLKKRYGLRTPSKLRRIFKIIDFGTKFGYIVGVSMALSDV